MGHHLSALPPISSDVEKYFDYYEKIALWSKVFGKENLNIRVYEKNELVNGNVCDDFSSAIKLPFDLPSTETNESLSRRSSLACHYLLGKGYQPNLIKHVKRNIKDDGLKILPGRAEAEEFLKHFDASNNKLLNFLGRKTLFNREFDAYPNESNFIMEEEDYDELLKAVVSYTVPREKKKQVLVVGDSHARVFSSKELQRKTRRINWNVCSVSGATLSGLSNPNSKTQALNVFDKALEKNSKRDALVFLLGEVDVGFVIWYRASRDEVTIKEALSKSLNNYEALIRKGKMNSPVFVLSAPLPTIPDYGAIGDVAKERSKIKASLEDRTELTLDFNSQLKSLCGRLGAHYIDCDVNVVNEEGGLRHEFYNDNPADHHYDESSYVSLISDVLFPGLRSVLFNKRGLKK
ncbi:hypothetical protein FZZ93_04165 [Halomonas eurihalina]|uniref:SGNH/GDSL hydrolase family protein n=1 Tax=Halomonas eurihalina TaxID=42566 RepID=A0A5D9DDE3_HALER|nr:hypothetical protein [Halomonas eurihalina]MDR5858481.1 hypothetical protein [Halomonas eurihalina]TZG40675.1 hypothetical protein FZZ93_04165 [Halomonas eurihalina]